jgi:hypothetical protein
MQYNGSNIKSKRRVLQAGVEMKNGIRKAKNRAFSSAKNRALISQLIRTEMQCNANTNGPSQCERVRYRSKRKANAAQKKLHHKRISNTTQTQ